MKVLIADDDGQMVRALGLLLRARGDEVIAARDGAEALQAATARHPDVCLVDLGMPKLSGFEVIEGIRAFSAVPILVLSGRTDSADKVRALDAGADDYVTKPFGVDELLARLRALVRRSGREGAAEPLPEAVVRMGEVSIDLGAHVVERAGAPVRLTPTEWKFLETLVRHAGRLVTRQMLYREIWGTDDVQDTGYLRLYVSQLRRKLEADPAHPVHLLTEQGMGYRLVLAP
ncbi:MAG: response regulator transcription factor [Arthrobacter sp.]|jgi:two-component system KDP operon response regulator KdpE|nr:response regulator transcription factor [Arthrobacter sp.]